jgi:hypothetical protein
MESCGVGSVMNYVDWILSRKASDFSGLLKWRRRASPSIFPPSFKVRSPKWKAEKASIGVRARRERVPMVPRETGRSPGGAQAGQRLPPAAALKEKAAGRGPKQVAQWRRCGA